MRGFHSGVDGDSSPEARHGENACWYTVKTFQRRFMPLSSRLTLELCDRVKHSKIFKPNVVAINVIHK